MSDHEDVISRKHLLFRINELMKSPWLNYGKDDDMIMRYGCVERKEAVEVVRDLCVKAEPAVTPKPFDLVLDEIRSEIEQEYTKFRNKSNMWSERACGLGTALEIIDKYKSKMEGETEKEQNDLWMNKIFDQDQINAKTEQWTKEAEEAGMTLTEYLESISPLNNKESEDKE